MNNEFLKELSEKDLNLNIEFKSDKSLKLSIIKYPNSPNEIKRTELCHHLEFERLDEMGINVFENQLYELIKSLSK
jgi:hypothetical protein